MRHLLLFLFLLLSLNPPAGAGGSYQAEVERWRKENEEKLFSDPRLMAVGRFELREGEQSVGSGPTNNLVLPIGPAALGTVELHGKTANIELRPGVTGTYNKQPITKAVVPVAQPTSPINPLWAGSVGLSIRERNGQIRLTVLDKQCEFVRARKPLHWFPVQARYRITAKFIPFDKPTTLSLPDSEGAQREYPSPGYVSFAIDGQTLTLQPIQSGDDLFFVFRDATAGKLTYGAGRFLDAEAPRNGSVILDFNKATNPLCAYNSFVVCPRPPKRNLLSVAIPAGERDYAPH
jgi:uncharacterized protein (DUF1684 family)